MAQAPREKPVTAVPLKAKLVHGIFANRVFGAEELKNRGTANAARAARFQR